MESSGLRHLDRQRESEGLDTRLWFVCPGTNATETCCFGSEGLPEGRDVDRSRLGSVDTILVDHGEVVKDGDVRMSPD